ncbi:unnamed protein product, partial [Ectocarpus sp. 12 AP-2014]
PVCCAAVLGDDGGKRGRSSRQRNTRQGEKKGRGGERKKPERESGKRRDTEDRHTWTRSALLLFRSTPFDPSRR